MSFNATRCKVQLKLAINRLKLLQQKKAALNTASKREIAALLDPKKNKEESARIRVEHVIREDYNIEALEILELYCELLLARFGLVEQMKHCDSGIAEAVNTIIYAAPRSEIQELNQVRDQLIAKYGKEFAMAAMENKNDIVNSRIVDKLKVATPNLVLVEAYLKEIAKAHNIPWAGLSVAPQDSLGIGTNVGTLGESTGYAYAQQYPGGAPVILPSQPAAPTVPMSFPPGFGLPQAPGVVIDPRPPPPPSAPSTSKLPPGAQKVLPSDVPPPVVPGNEPSSMPDFPVIPPGSPKKRGPDAPPPGPGGDDGTGDLPDFDELTKRFEALKKRK